MTATDQDLLRRRPTLLADGVSDTEIRCALRRGELLRLDRGTYALTDVYQRLDAEQRHLVRARAEGERAGCRDPDPTMVLSHVSAAVVHGLPLLGTGLDRVHLTRHGRGGSSVTPRRQVHCGLVPAEHRTVRRGLAVSTVARTLVDLGRSTSFATAVVAGDAAAHRGLVLPQEVLRVLAAMARTTGVPAARRALQAVDGRAESPGETRLRLLLAARGLHPEAQVVVRDDGGCVVGRADFGFLDDGVLVEFDGCIKYAGRRGGAGSVDGGDLDVVAVVVAEKHREERLTALGWRVVRVTWDELVDDDSLVRRIQQGRAEHRTSVRTLGLRGSATPLPAVPLLPC